MEKDREFLGELVRMVWVEWAKKQANPKQSWLIEWGNLSANQREVDCLIGVKVSSVATALIQRQVEQLQAENEKLQALRDLMLPFYKPKCDIAFDSNACHPECPHQEQCKSPKENKS